MTDRLSLRQRPMFKNLTPCGAQQKINALLDACGGEQEVLQ